SVNAAASATADPAGDRRASSASDADREASNALSAGGKANEFARALDTAKFSAVAGNAGRAQESVIAQIKMAVANVGAQKGDRTISLELSPRELGNIDVHMRMSKDGKTTIAIAAERADTLSL